MTVARQRSGKLDAVQFIHGINHVDDGSRKWKGGELIILQGIITECISIVINGPFPPVALGNGLPLFKDLARPLRLHLAEAKSFPGGTVIHVYRSRS